MDIYLPLLDYPITTRTDSAGVPQVYDPVRRRWFVLTPEEHVRQHLLRYLIKVGYPKGMIAVEKQTGQLGQRFDIVVYDRNHQPWLIVECKAPDVPIAGYTLAQIARYHAAMPCTYWLLTNGVSAFCAQVSDSAEEALLWLSALPVYEG